MESKVRILIGLVLICCIPRQLDGAHLLRSRRDVALPSTTNGTVTSIPEPKEPKHVKESSLDVVNDTTDLKKSNDAAPLDDNVAESKTAKVISDKTKSERNKKGATDVTGDKRSTNKENTTTKREPVTDRADTNGTLENVTDSHRETGRSLDIDIEKYTSPEFQNKNNVYILPTSPEIEKYLDPDARDIFPTKPAEDKPFTSSTVHNFNDAITTPLDDLFDAKYRSVTNGIKQNLDDIDAKLKELKDSNEEKDKDKYDVVKIKDDDKDEKNITLHFVEYKNIEKNNSKDKGKKHEDTEVETSKQIDYHKTYLKTRVIDDKNSTTDIPSQNKIKIDPTKYTINESVPHSTSSTEQNPKSVSPTATMRTVSDNSIASSRRMPTGKNLSLPESNSTTQATSVDSLNKEKVMYTPQSNDNTINIAKRGSTKYAHTIVGTSTPSMASELSFDNKNFSLPPSATAWTLVGMKQTPVTHTNNATATTNDVKFEKEQDAQENQLFKTIIATSTMIYEGSTEGLPSSDFKREDTVQSDAQTTRNSTVTERIMTSNAPIGNNTNITSPSTDSSFSTTVAETSYNTREMLTTNEMTSTTNKIESRTMEIPSQPTTTKNQMDTIESSVGNMNDSTTTEIMSSTSETLENATISDATSRSSLTTKETGSISTDTSNTSTVDDVTDESSVSSSYVTSVSFSTSQVLPTTKPTPAKENLSTTEFITETESTGDATTTNQTDFDASTSELDSTSFINYTTSIPPQDIKISTKTIPSTTTSIPFTTVTKSPNSDDDIFEGTDENGNDYDNSGMPETKTNDKDIEATQTESIKPTEKQTERIHPKTTVQIPVVIDKMVTTELSNEHGTSQGTSSSKSISDGGTDEESHPGIVAAIAISAVAGVCLVILAGLLLIMRKRQKKMTYGQRCRPVSLDAYSLDNVSVYNSVRRKGALRASKRSYGNPAFEDPVTVSHPMNFQILAKFSENFEAIGSEFEDIPMVTARANEVPPGCETKNRYANVIPLPETRVFLKPSDNDPTSDYINANYVTGPKNTRGYYIACQAPLQSTVDDFWRMVWEQQSRVILMLTNLYENGVEKCADYLPPSEVLDCHRLFGDYQITLKKREVKEKYIISSLQLKNMVSNSWREVTHLWYLGWPERGVPHEANSLIAFLIEARSHLKAASNNNTSDTKMEETSNMHISNGSTVDGGPVVVHCSPGTGRTGTVIACDIAIRDFELTRSVDIPNIVYRVRRDRASAVQTKDQYCFIYKVITLYATKLTGGALDSI